MERRYSRSFTPPSIAFGMTELMQETSKPH
jgi:hypothetical protein